MADLNFEGQKYPNPRLETMLVDGYQVVIAEVSNLPGGRYPRTHRRIVGGEGTDVASRILIYSDTYAGAPADPTYAYARHDVDHEEFFKLLEEFLLTAILVDFSELENRKAPCVFQTRNEINEVEYDSYLAAVNSLRSRTVQFARLYFPFGDMTVNFGQASIIENELGFISNGTLSGALETPLFAFDASNSDVWITFMTMIHWARNLVEPAVLRTILSLAARAYA